MTSPKTTRLSETGLAEIVKQVTSIRRINDFCFSRDDRELFFISNLGEYYRIWSVPTGGGFPRELTLLDAGDVKSMKLSPDGLNLAFLVDNDGSENMDLMVIPAGGGSPALLTGKLKMSMPDFTWSPDSRHIAAVCEANQTYNVVIIDSRTGESRRVTDTPDVKLDLDWSPDGRLILYAGYKEVLTSHICALEVNSGRVRVLSRMLKGENLGARFSPSGKNIGFTSNAGGMKNVVLMDIENESAVWMTKDTKDDCEEQFLEWNKSGNRFAFLRNHRGELTIRESTFPPTDTRRLSAAGFSGIAMRYGNTTDQVAVKLMSANRPPEVYIQRHKSLRKLTDSMPLGLETEQFTAPREVRFKSFDNREIPGFYYTPPGAAGYPVLFWLHGGPTSQHYNGWDPFIQLFIQAGIAVLAPNVRGSSGYGREFESANFYDWGGGDLKDVMAGVEFVRTDEKADRNRLVVGGASYGGYLTMMAVTHHPRVWAGGINLMGIVNLENFYRNSSRWIKPLLEKKHGFRPPEEDPAYYYNRSPVNFVDRIECPILMMYGKSDSRVPISELHQLRKALQDGGKVFEAEILDREGHTMNRSDSRMEYYTRVIAFIRKYVHGLL